ncbi:DUF4190 domain-containing protein [Candidatus Sumerlaeota bacterium]|nr:DUF4190 domain-containing protein [Candidatus Sumerlaeota bacterium]
MNRTNTLAVVSLVLGILSLIACGCAAGIPAIVCGHIAKGQIRSTGEQGEGLATAGFILGWISLILSILGMCLYFFIVGMAVAAPAMQSSGSI